MSNRSRNSRLVTKVISKSHTIVVFTQVITNVECGNCTPGKVWKCHYGMVHLVYYYIEVVFHWHGLYFNLSSPCSILLQITQVLIYSFIILNKGCIIILISFNKLYSFISIFSMYFLISFNLVSNGTKQAISITSYLLQTQTKRC